MLLCIFPWFQTWSFANYHKSFSAQLTCSLRGGPGGWVPWDSLLLKLFKALNLYEAIVLKMVWCFVAVRIVICERLPVFIIKMTLLTLAWRNKASFNIISRFLLHWSKASSLLSCFALNTSLLSQANLVHAGPSSHSYVNALNSFRVTRPSIVCYGGTASCVIGDIITLCIYNLLCSTRLIDSFLFYWKECAHHRCQAHIATYDPCLNIQSSPAMFRSPYWKSWHEPCIMPWEINEHIEKCPISQC